MRRIAVLSTGRQDWGILRSTCEFLRDDPAFDLALILGGMHCSRRFGLTRRLVEQDGFAPSELLPWISDEGDDPPQQQAGRAVSMVADALARRRPEALLLVGDRFETAAAALAATMSRVPVVHLQGGEETEGAIDNALRHSITKQAHLHLVSHPEYAARVVAMGEDPGSVHVVGAPGLDNLQRRDLEDRRELERQLGLELLPPVVIVTLHPATLGGSPAAGAEAVREAMGRVDATYIITLPNVDPGNEVIREVMIAAAGLPRRRAVEALGERRFWSLMRQADAMLGNSSSALIEAPGLGLPAVNVGDRQKGRLRGGNVLDVPAAPDAIAAALLDALSPSFRAEVRSAPCPFGSGGGGRAIVEILRHWVPPRPPIKRGVVSGGA